MTPYYQDAFATIYHGDCRDVMPAVSASADVLVTDPPYGIGHSVWSGNDPAIIGDPKMSRTADRVISEDHVAVRDETLRLWGERPALVFGAWRAPKPQGTLQRLIWDKGSIGPGGFGPWRSVDEELYVLGRGWLEGSRDVPSIIRVTRPAKGDRPHPNIKPVGLMALCLSWCPASWVVLDPFMGSGSTLRAAKDLGRRAIGVEIEERYCEVAARRLSQEVLDFGAAS